MPGSGTRTFLEPDHYEASLRQAQIEILIALSPKFKARLTWAELHDLQVLQCEEDFPRVAYVCLGPQLSFVTFPAHSGPLPVWGGTELRPGEIVFHGRGERLHQSTPASFVWNVIALDPVQLEQYGRALSGKPFTLPSEGKILRPSPRDVARLRRLHAQVCRLAETKPKLLAHTEVARAIEQGLIQTLVACLTAASMRADGATKRRHARIMIRFEEVLAEHLSEPLHTTELCERIGGDRVDPALMLRRIPWHEPDPVCAVAPVEPGTCRVARRRSRRGKPLGACPRLRFCRARTFRGGLPGGL